MACSCNLWHHVNFLKDYPASEETLSTDSESKRTPWNCSEPKVINVKCLQRMLQLQILLSTWILESHFSSHIFIPHLYPTQDNAQTRTHHELTQKCTNTVHTQSDNTCKTLSSDSSCVLMCTELASGNVPASACGENCVGQKRGQLLCRKWSVGVLSFCHRARWEMLMGFWCRMKFWGPY